eukprot:2500948-Rhodomonas_salina.1
MEIRGFQGVTGGSDGIAVSGNGASNFGEIGWVANSQSVSLRVRRKLEARVLYNLVFGLENVGDAVAPHVRSYSVTFRSAIEAGDYDPVVLLEVPVFVDFSLASQPTALQATQDAAGVVYILWGAPLSAGQNGNEILLGFVLTVSEGQSGQLLLTMEETPWALNTSLRNGTTPDTATARRAGESNNVILMTRGLQIEIALAALNDAGTGAAATLQLEFGAIECETQCGDGR